MFGLLHNCVLHPLYGVLWCIADASGSKRLKRSADKLHKSADKLHKGR